MDSSCPLSLSQAEVSRKPDNTLLLDRIRDLALNDLIEGLCPPKPPLILTSPNSVLPKPKQPVVFNTPGRILLHSLS